MGWFKIKARTNLGPQNDMYPSPPPLGDKSELQTENKPYMLKMDLFILLIPSISVCYAYIKLDKDFLSFYSMFKKQFPNIMGKLSLYENN